MIALGVLVIHRSVLQINFCNFIYAGQTLLLLPVMMDMLNSGKK